MRSRLGWRVGWAWVVLVAGGCAAGAGASGGAPGTGLDAGAGAGRDAADAVATGDGAPTPVPEGGPDARDGGDRLGTPATTGAVIFPEVAAYTHDACATRTRDGWCWVTPRPQGSFLADLSTQRPGELWAVGDDGTVLHGLVEGYPVHWALVDAGLASDLTAVSAAADGTVFIGSSTGEVLQRDAATGGWTPLPAPGLAKITGLWAASHDDAWAVGGDATVYHWTGSGGWTAADLGPDGVTAVVGRGPDDVWMATEIGHSVHWDGTVFAAGDIAVQPRPQFPLTNIASFSRMGRLDDGTIWAALHTTFDGGCWALSGGVWSPAKAYTIAGASLADHWAAGFEGQALHVSPYGPDGADETFLGDGPVLAGGMNDLWAISVTRARHGVYGSWDPDPTLFQAAEYVHVAASGDVWVTGLRTQDWSTLVARWDGVQWSLFPIPNANDPPTVTSRGSDVWLAGESLWHWNGGALEELPYPTSPPLGAGWSARAVFATADAVWVFGDTSYAGGDALLRYDGNSWRFVPLPASYKQGIDGPGLRGTSERDFWLLNGLSVYHFDGQTWSDPVVLPGSGQYGIRDLWPLAPDDVWAGLFHFDGTSWTATAPPDSLGSITGMWADRDDDVFALTSTGFRHWDGRGWSGPLPLPTSGSWYEISATNADDLWLTGPGVAHGAPPVASPSP